jgi:hypothetical protein
MSQSWHPISPTFFSNNTQTTQQERNLEIEIAEIENSKVVKS